MRVPVAPLGRKKTLRPRYRSSQDILHDRRDKCIVYLPPNALIVLENTARGRSGPAPHTAYPYARQPHAEKQTLPSDCSLRTDDDNNRIVIISFLPNRTTVLATPGAEVRKGQEECSCRGCIRFHRGRLHRGGQGASAPVLRISLVCTARYGGASGTVSLALCVLEFLKCDGSPRLSAV